MAASKDVRSQRGEMASAVGIALNLLLFAGKLWAGAASGSLSVTADAMNNLSDAGNAGIGFMGFVLASRPADEEHPYGHARYEYLASLTVSVLICAVGVGLLHDAVVRIVQPRPVYWSTATALVLAGSIAAKLALACFDWRMAGELSSGTLRAAMWDSVSDAVSTLAVLLGMALSRALGVHTDGWLSAAVAVLVLAGAVKLIRETVSELLGRVPKPEEVQVLREKLMASKGVLGVHDILIHNYGPGHRYASAHVEVPGAWTQMKSHAMIDALERRIGREMGLSLVIHCDPVALDDPRLPEMRVALETMLRQIDSRITLHDLRITPNGSRTRVTFDCVVPYDLPVTARELQLRVAGQFRERFGQEYACIATVEHSYTGGK